MTIGIVKIIEVNAICLLFADKKTQIIVSDSYCCFCFEKLL